MQVQFYHLTHTRFERALPPLLNKAVQAEYQVMIKLSDKQAVKKMDDWLWSYDPDSFLPHGIEGSDHSDQQPIYLTTQADDRPNAAKVIIVTDGTTYGEAPDETEKLLDLFDGNSEPEVQAARQRWKQYKDAGYDLTYWQQQPGGGWKKAA